MGAPQPSDLTGVLLAGGDGTRLGGVAKGRLARGGRTLAERAIEALGAVSGTRIVVANDPWYERLGVPAHRDLRRGMGPLAGLETALTVARTEHVLVVACDMPSLRPALLSLVARRDARFDAVVPVARGVLQPLCARYSRRCLPAATRTLDAGIVRMVEVFGAIEADGFAVERLDEDLLRTVDPDLSTFDDANTPEDLARLGVERP